MKITVDVEIERGRQDLRGLRYEKSLCDLRKVKVSETTPTTVDITGRSDQTSVGLGIEISE